MKGSISFISLFISFSLFLFLMPFSSAYIDPGTGGLIIRQSGNIFAGILAVIIGFLGAYFWKPLKKAILALWNALWGKK